MASFELRGEASSRTRVRVNLRPADRQQAITLSAAGLGASPQLRAQRHTGAALFNQELH